MDLRDHYGITQVVVHPDREFFGKCEHLKLESVLTITGDVMPRSTETINPDLGTGEVEVFADEMIVESGADMLPLHLALFNLNF